MTRFITRFLRDDSGATAIEYGLICALIFLVIIGSISAFAKNATDMFDTISATITDAMGRK